MEHEARILKSELSVPLQALMSSFMFCHISHGGATQIAVTAKDLKYSYSTKITSISTNAKHPGIIFKRTFVEEQANEIPNREPIVPGFMRSQHSLRSRNRFIQTHPDFLISEKKTRRKLVTKLVVNTKRARIVFQISTSLRNVWKKWIFVNMT